MTRSDALDFITAEFGALATKAGLTATDDTAGHKPAIDAALRALDVERSALATAAVDTADEGKFEALLRYHSLARIWSVLATREDVDLSGAGVGIRRSQPFAHVKAMLAEYKERVEDLGLLGGSASFGRLGLDFLEPELAA